MSPTAYKPTTQIRAISETDKMLLMIDNYDSFTFNLVQYFGELGQEVQVFRNDQISIETIAALNPDYLVISPGPCTPAEAGISVEAIKYFAGKLPILVFAWGISLLVKLLVAMWCEQKWSCMAKPHLCFVRIRAVLKTYRIRWKPRAIIHWWWIKQPCLTV